MWYDRDMMSSRSGDSQISWRGVHEIEFVKRMRTKLVAEGVKKGLYGRILTDSGPILADLGVKTASKRRDCWYKVTDLCPKCA